MRRLLLALTAGVASLGLAAGWRASSLTEGDVILHYAHRYVAETGGALGDCHAEPLESGWLTVICEGQGGARRYRVGWGGWLLPRGGGETSI